MFKNVKYPFVKVFSLIGFVFLIVMSCKNKQDDKETILQGSASFLVDETIRPIIEDQVAVFESQYPAKITQINKSESEIINLMISGKGNIAFLSRKLTAQEAKAFENKSITPRITKFAVDAIALISNKAANDSIVDLQQVINLMQGKPSTIKGLVFENPNSSTVRYMDSLAGVSNTEKPGIYSLKSHEDVLKYVSENKGVIGVVGLNNIVQPDPTWQKYMDVITVMGVSNVKNKAEKVVYYKPNQSNLALGLYPMQRNLYMLNYQGSAGLGMGFASFIAGEIGQRIVLKSALLPVTMPGRSVSIRKEIINNK